MQNKNIFTKINVVKAAAILAFLVCDVFLLIIIWNSRSTAELVLNITSFVFAVVLSAIFVRSLFLYTKNQQKFWELVDGLTQTNEHIEQLESSKTALYSIFSEKLRTPLQVIHGYSSMVLEGTFGKTDGPIHDIVERIFRASETMSTLAEEIISASQKTNAEVAAASPVSPTLSQSNSWKRRAIMIRILCVLALAFLLIQIILATSTFGLAIRIGVTVFAILISFFITNELAHEPEARRATENLVGDLNIATSRLKVLEDERATLLSHVSTGLHSSLTVIAENAHKLLDGSFGDIPEAMTEAVENISKSGDQLTVAVSELTNILGV